MEKREGSRVFRCIGRRLQAERALEIMFPEFNVSNTKPKFLGVTNKYTSSRRPSY